MKKILAVTAFILAGVTGYTQDIKKLKIEALVNMIDTSTSPLVVNFWASWCQPCVREIPWFEKAVAEYQSKGVRMVLVSLDFSEDFNKRLSISLNVVDPFRPQQFTNFTYGRNFLLESFNRTRSRNFRVAISYQLNKVVQKKTVSDKQKKAAIEKAMGGSKAKE